MTDEPTKPSHPRPNDEPYYIECECECGEELVLHDNLSDEQYRKSDALVSPKYQVEQDIVWYDEWVCPECLDGVHMDWPSKSDIEKSEKWQNIIEDNSTADEL